MIGNQPCQCLFQGKRRQRHFRLKSLSPAGPFLIPNFPPTTHYIHTALIHNVSEVRLVPSAGKSSLKAGQTMGGDAGVPLSAILQRGFPGPGFATLTPKNRGNFTGSRLTAASRRASPLQVVESRAKKNGIQK